MSDSLPTEYWQSWAGPTGTTGPNFLGVTGAVTGPSYFGVTGATGPTAGTVQTEHPHVKYLYDRARIELVGASDAMIRMVMRDMFHEFFNDTSLWREAIPGILYPDAKTYYLEPGNAQSLGDPFPSGRIIGLAGVQGMNHFPVYADMPQPPILRLLFSQSNETAVWVTVIKNVALAHYSELPEVPKWTVDVYEPYLLAGIKGLLQLQLDRPYSDMKSGQMNYGQFRRGVGIGRTRAIRNNVWGGQAWAYPQTFRTNSQHGWAVSTGNDRVF